MTNPGGTLSARIRANAPFATKITCGGGRCVQETRPHILHRARRAWAEATLNSACRMGILGVALPRR